MKCERAKEGSGERRWGEGGRGGDEKMIRRREREVRWVNKENERVGHHGPGELEKAEK